MALLNFEQEMGRAAPEWPFANGYEFESWSSIWCSDCVHENYCTLPLVAVSGRTPAAWREREEAALNRYTCHEYENKDSEPTVQNIIRTTLEDT